MANKKKIIFNKTLLKLLLLVISMFSAINKLKTLIALEARLAERSVIALIILSLFMGSLLVSAWLCLVAMLVIHLVSLQWSWSMSLLLACVLNSFLFFLAGFIVMRIKKNLFFPLTRRQLRMKE